MLSVQLHPIFTHLCDKASALLLGIDLLFERGFAGHRVVEANAFGDLLPGLSRGGLDTYGWEIQAVLDASAKDSP